MRGLTEVAELVLTDEFKGGQGQILGKIYIVLERQSAELLICEREQNREEGGKMKMLSEKEKKKKYGRTYKWQNSMHQEDTVFNALKGMSGDGEWMQFQSQPQR